MEPITITKGGVEVKPSNGNNICSCYDDECRFVKNPDDCFMGFPNTVNFGVADGICPLIHQSN